MLNKAEQVSDFKQIGVLICVVIICTNLFSCAGSGGNSSIFTQTLVSGTVQAPNGQIAFAPRQNLFDEIAALIMPTANALTPGLTPVPDGTVVKLERINDSGAIVTVIATTKTSGGSYSFNLSELSLSQRGR